MDEIYNSIIEALIFSSDDPIPSSEIIKAIKEIDGADTDITPKDVESAVDSLNERYEDDEKSFSIKRIANGFAFGTKAEYAKYVGFLSSVKSKRRLSQAALETLSIIAYKQPITKPEIENLRGVNSDYMMNTLLEKNLITIKGRSETIGRPLLYVTTDEFLKYFGLNKISDLPKPREVDDIMKDEDFIEEKRKIMMNQIEEVIENELESEGENGNETK
ncbi:MAG: SMC-Scp complex subunit ScpB [Ignavibacteriales bacterium CG18_big_fil_WC_8_21_14_2_50_31_20]|nr:MAG: SMC-Scp complex subunit ScpB [Ignavibacteriales bacterium CG18_big_fil_WC_8_21_14_2_50_31_20]